MLTELLQEQHMKHPSYGYHRLAVEVFRETGWIFSHNLAHKCCKQAGIHSKARRHYRYRRPGGENLKFPNITRGKWHPKEPLQLVTSDMTVLHSRGKQYEWTLLIDAFNNEILAHQVSDRPGDSRPYYHVLNELIKLSLTKKEKTAPIVFHSDQGAVFSSRAFFKAHEQYTIQRSMSRIGTPTDNPVIEALNGWIKEELLTDFGLSDTSDVKKLLDEYVEYYNHQRPAAALQYKSPIQFKHERGF
jgi:transposase InsO family protein